MIRPILSTIFLLCQRESVLFIWQRKLEYPQKTTVLLQDAEKYDHMNFVSNKLRHVYMCEPRSNSNCYCHCDKQINSFSSDRHQSKSN